MADLAQAAPCLVCGTLTTVSGYYGDEQLVGACPNPGCGEPMVVRLRTTPRNTILGPIHPNVGGGSEALSVETVPAVKSGEGKAPPMPEHGPSGADTESVQEHRAEIGAKESGQ